MMKPLEEPYGFCWEASPGPPPPPFTRGSYKAIEHSARHLHILHVLQQPHKNHFKAPFPAVPTLFHLSNADNTVTEFPERPTRGTTAHLLPAPVLHSDNVIFHSWTIHHKSLLAHINSSSATQTLPYRPPINQR